MQWIKNLWLDGQWYEHVYMVSILVLVISLIIYVPILAPYNRILEQIEREYRKLSTGHFFLSFRKAKQQELYNKAVNSVALRSNKYFYYTLGNIFSFTTVASLTVGFWFFIGSLIYEGVFLDTDDDIKPAITQDVENYYGDDVIEESDDNTHHVSPHSVDGYERSDGTKVEGYWRGGADGYERSNPDGDHSNNLSNSDSYSDNGNSSGPSLGDIVIDSIFGN